ncbi:MAG: helix-hairpin-helix domain-containing protein, partial [Chlorobi bacterium]|nr:helix-hairpin-helix domain-containing protein [Chlorobiota bacterium]
MSFKEQLKEYFNFTKSESRGIFVLLAILVVTVLVNQTVQYFIPEKKNDFSEYEKIFAENEKDTFPDLYDENINPKTELFKFNPNNFTKKEAEKLGISDFQYKMIQKYIAAGGSFKYKEDFAKIYSLTQEQYKKLYPYINLPEHKTYDKKTKHKPNKNTPGYFFFNPATLNDDGWKKLGFSDKQVKSIRKYIDNGGKFYKKEDLKKLYVISNEKYAELEPYIIIEKTKNKPEKQKERKPVDINNLSANEMKKYGKFWQYNAERIVKYRNLLGGYYKKEQLLEVYGVKKQYYDKIAGDIIIDKTKLKKINVNFAEVSELGRHPYISYELAGKIISFRNNHGFIDDLKILKENKIISSNDYEKIKNYLKV